MLVVKRKTCKKVTTKSRKSKGRWNTKLGTLTKMNKDGSIKLSAHQRRSKAERDERRKKPIFKSEKYW